MTKLDRRSVLFGALGGGAITTAAGLTAWLPERRATPITHEDERFYRSFAQFGEDLVVAATLAMYEIARPTYLDIGAHHPTLHSNTWLLYGRGSRGVLVEPNPEYVELLRKKRDGDTVLEIGIGISDQREADYYVITGDGTLNTFSKEQADALTARIGPSAISKVIKRPLVPVNEVLARHFAGGAPDFVSIDVEGLDLAILRTFDFERFRPKVFCVETSLLDGTLNQPLVDLMKEKGYSARGGSFVNTVFIDERARPTNRHGH